MALVLLPLSLCGKQHISPSVPTEKENYSGKELKWELRIVLVGLMVRSPNIFVHIVYILDNEHPGHFINFHDFPRSGKPDSKIPCC